VDCWGGCGEGGEEEEGEEVEGVHGFWVDWLVGRSVWISDWMCIKCVQRERVGMIDRIS